MQCFWAHHTTKISGSFSGHIEIGIERGQLVATLRLSGTVFSRSFSILPLQLSHQDLADLPNVIERAIKETVDSIVRDVGSHLETIASLPGDAWKWAFQ